jgi:hypothetical protein
MTKPMENPIEFLGLYLTTHQLTMLTHKIILELDTKNHNLDYFDKN